MKRLSIFLIFGVLAALSFNFLIGQAQRQTRLLSDPCIPGGTPACPEPTPVPPRVASVVFEEVNSPLTSPSPMGTGKRIFPDKNSPTDSVNRKVVRVKATLNSPPDPETGYKIIFKAFDVDDPSSDTTIDPNDAVTSGAGNDNRPNGSPGTLSRDINQPGNTSGLVFAVQTIEVVVYLTVTMQPGNNVVVAAAIGVGLDGVTIDGINLKDSSGATLPTDDIKRTELLTTWRRFHIEIDSMGAVQNNYVEGIIPNDIAIRRNQTVTIALNPNSTMETNRFEGGRLVANGYSLPIACNIAFNVNCNTGNTVHVVNDNLTTVFIPANSTFTLYDDDDFDDDDGVNFDGDTLPSPGENISIPGSFTNLLAAGSNEVTTNVFAPAYVQPVYDMGDNNDNVGFVANLSSESTSDVRSLFDIDYNNNTNTDADNDYWTVYVLGAYQSISTRDGDPSTQDKVLGIVDEITGVTGSLEGSGALIFMELNRPKELVGLNYTYGVDVTVAHEVGHLFSGEHNQGGLMGNSAGVPQSKEFSPTTIAKIRSLMHP